MELLGRERETGVLAQALAEIRGDGRQRALAIIGEAGIGKSALLDDAGTAADGTGVLALQGRAAEHEREVPFGLVIDALDDHVATLHPARLATIGAELAAVLPAAARDDVPAVAVGGPAERFRYHRALRGLLELLGRERPLALLLDDVHWADEASIELILHLLRRPPRAPFLLVCALRPSSPATRLLDAGRRAAGWEELHPAPLAPAAARALLPAELDRPVRERILREAGGNPLFLRELVRLGPQAGDALPPTLAAVIAQELDGLGATARLFAAGAAIAGDPFDLDVATAAAGVPEEDAVAALDELVAADLVRADRGRVCRFRHPLVHRAVADAAPPGWKLRAHERAAAVLAARGAAPAVRAYHVEQFARADDAESLDVLVAAAESSLDTSPLAAAHWYAAALRLLPHRAGARPAELLAPMALALASGGRLQESRTAMSECLALLGPDDAARRAELTATMAVVELLLGAFADADARLTAGLADAPPAARPRLMRYRAAMAFFRDDPDGVLTWAERAAAALDERTEPVQLAAAESQRGLGLALRGQPAYEAMARAAQRLRDASDEQLAKQVDVAWTVGGNLGQIERYREAVDVLRRGVRLARTARQGHLLLQFHTLAAMFELPLLELDTALEHVDAAEEITRLQGLDFQLAFTLSQRARVLAARGDVVSAERAAVESDEILRPHEGGGAVRTNLAHNAIVRLGADPEHLLAALTQIGGERLERINRTAVGWLLLPAVRAALELDRLGDAELWAELAAAEARPDLLPASALRAARARAEVLLARGAPDDATVLAADAIADAERAGLRQEELGARLLHGRTLLAAGRRERGLAELQHVATEAGRRGALADRDAAARELRRAGARVSMEARRAADAAGDGELTPREREIAELVANGGSNKQVAAVLFVSEKTVERHLSTVYAKLRVRSRTELAGVMHDAMRRSPTH